MIVPTKAAVRDDPNILFVNKPASPIGDMPVDVQIVAQRCVYVNNYRIAGAKPYVSEQLPSHTLTTSLRQIISAFGEKAILAALDERKSEQEYFAAYHAQTDEQSTA